MINVIIVDDSAVVRSVTQQLLQRQPDIKVIATAPDPIIALQKMQQCWPDVLILDVEMPRMDGVTFLRQIMQQRPTPIIICSSLAESGSETALQALAAGAVSIITKPTAKLTDFLLNQEIEIVEAVREAAATKLRSPLVRQTPVAQSSDAKLSADVILAPPQQNIPMSRTTDRIIAIGTSTGGTQALEYVLPKLPKNTNGMVIVQHMPAQFTRMFAERLNKISQIDVKEAETGDRIINGRALIAPGGKHMLVKRNGAQYVVEIVDGPLVTRHRPSVDVLFRSVAKSAGSNALGVIMTGMGDDGARGMKEMLDSGAKTVAQDEDSCIVFGMPKEAIRYGGVTHVAGLDHIPGIISGFGN